MATVEFLPEAVHHDSAESLSPLQKQTLEGAVAKIVALGAQVGVSVDQMIQLLQSGLTVGELLDYLAAQSGEVA
jgi:hypothetical protein